VRGRLLVSLACTAMGATVTDKRQDESQLVR
jgi:hypothetical protein